ncbi:MAG: hypothetical protein K6F34_00450 [Lachnospiraceae bacterium]|nr:hypothetical protein [Lachnospiraceae bacterium]
MTLMITVYAAIISTIVWYNRKDDSLKTGLLCFIYWGASLMWLVDAFFEYFSEGADYFNPAAQDMINDAFLGFAAVALGLIIWMIRLLVTDPKGSVRRALSKQDQ